MGNAGSMNQHTDLRGHNMPLKLPMPEPGELEEKFGIVLVRKLKEEEKKNPKSCVPSALCSLHASVSWDGTAVCRLDLFVQHASVFSLLSEEKWGILTKKVLFNGKTFPKQMLDICCGLIKVIKFL